MGFDSLKQDLMTILEEEAESFRKMRDLLEEEKRALVRDDIEAIRSATERQEGMAEEVRLIEARRLHVTRSIGQRFGLQDDQLTLSRISGLYEGADAERMRAVREELLDLHAEIRQKNRNNALLIRHAMRYADRTLRLLKGGDGSNRVYQRTGVPAGVASGLRAAVNRVA
jgi:flagellar biosynthesis/type III secretory pathway chaperone